MLPLIAIAIAIAIAITIAIAIAPVSGNHRKPLFPLAGKVAAILRGKKK